MSTFEERLNRMLPRLTSKELLNNQGLSNEIGFWVFDYPPERELEMRAFTREVIEPALARNYPPIRFASVNIFDIAIGVLEKRGLLDKTFEMQMKQGNIKVLESLRRVLKEDKLAVHLVAQLDLANLDLVILTGVGSAYPILRTHTLLSALHPLMRDTPLLMMYPGKYDGYSFRLFNTLSEDHYYRAFRLVS